MGQRLKKLHKARTTRDTSLTYAPVAASDSDQIVKFKTMATLRATFWALGLEATTHELEAR